MPTDEKPILILISGGSGSGKSTLAKKVSQQLDQKYGKSSSLVIEMDNYYKPVSEMPQHLLQVNNFDHPDMFDIDLFSQDVKNLVNGKPIKIPNFSFLEKDRNDFKEETKPAKFIIVEGIFSLQNKDINKLASNIFFIEVNQKERKLRIIQRNLLNPRNLEETEETITKKLENSVFPMHDQYIEPKKVLANAIINNNANTSEINIIAANISHFIINHFNFSHNFPQSENSLLSVYDLETKELEIQKQAKSEKKNTAEQEDFLVF